jgi:hypothetical protein
MATGSFTAPSTPHIASPTIAAPRVGLAVAREAILGEEPTFPN